MRKYWVSFFLPCAISLLSSCNQENYSEQIDEINHRLDSLENIAIATVNQQILNIQTSITSLEETDSGLKEYINGLQASSQELQRAIDANSEKIDQVRAELDGEMNVAKAEVLAELQDLQATMQSNLVLINESLDSLRKSDKALELRIDNLKAYVDGEIKNTKDWATATFSTLEQYNLTVSEITAVKNSIESINAALTALEERVGEKISKDIKAASEALESSIAQKTTEITNAYYAAIAQAKGEIETAYTNAIRAAISSSETTMQAWVNGRLTGFCTIAETESKIAALSAEFNTKVEAQKAYYDGMISSLSDAVNLKINDNKSLITSLRSDLTSLQGEVSTLEIISNAETISTNTANIAANALAISNNASAIEANSELIAANKKAVEDNAAKLNKISSSLDSLGNVVSPIVKKVSDNARAIADNAELISANSVAITNNAQAISDNTADITKLKSDLNTAKTDITSAYTLAIQSAITELDGKMDANITAKINTVNQNISALTIRIDGLQARIVTLEEDMTVIKGKVTTIIADIASIQTTLTNLINRIQSVSYIPRYTDNMMRLGVYVKADQSDGKVVVGEFEVQPHAVADDIIANPSVLSMKAVYTITRSSIFMDMPIVSISKVEDGVLSIEAACDNIDVDNLPFDKSFSAALSVSTENANYTSAYIPVNSKPIIKFADPVVKRALIRYGVDTDKDGEVSFDEAEKVSSFNDLYTRFMNRDSGVSFQELKYFINLRSITGYFGCQNVWLPDGLLTIGDNAFNASSANFDSFIYFKSIRIPDSVETIGQGAFLSCYYLQNVYISPTSHLKTIGIDAFNTQALETITLPASLEQIDRYGFNCINLRTVIMLGKTPPTLHANAFENAPLEAIYVPADAIEDYNLSNWRIEYRKLIKPMQ